VLTKPANWETQLAQMHMYHPVDKCEPMTEWVLPPGVYFKTTSPEHKPQME